MNTTTIDNMRNMFDHIFLSNQWHRSEEIFQTLQETWLEWLAEIIERNKRNWFFNAARPLVDLVEVSLFMYSTMEYLPITKKIELPTQNGNYKFIIAGVNTRRDGESAEKSHLIMLATPQAMHAHIAAWLTERHKNSSIDSLFAEAIKDMKIKVIGGWRIAINHDTKDLQANQSSWNYWTLSNELVEWFLQDYQKQWYNIGIDMHNQWKFDEYSE